MRNFSLFCGKYYWNWTKDVEVTEEEEFGGGAGLVGGKKEKDSDLFSLQAEVSLSYETGLTMHKAGWIGTTFIVFLKKRYDYTFAHT